MIKRQRAACNGPSPANVRTWHTVAGLPPPGTATLDLVAVCQHRNDLDGGRVAVGIADGQDGPVAGRRDLARLAAVEEFLLGRGAGDRG